MSTGATQRQAIRCRRLQRHVWLGAAAGHRLPSRAPVANRLVSLWQLMWWGPPALTVVSDSQSACERECSMPCRS